MEFLKIVALAVIITLSGCAQRNAITQNNVSSTASNYVEPADVSKPRVNPRVGYLKDLALLAGKNLDNFNEVDSLFVVMKALQDGVITTSDLSEAFFYFRDGVGHDSGYLYDSTYFRCIEVHEAWDFADGSGGEVPGYMAVYTNAQINMSIVVVWTGIRPLVGQKLNSDFLIYVNAEVHKNKMGMDRIYVLFLRPEWGGPNGYSYYQ